MYGVQVTIGAPNVQSGKYPRLHWYNVVEVTATENDVGNVVAATTGAVKDVQ